ncbi:MAG: carboxyl transferase domain-containing protein, partial [Candidatus Binatia bacterium]
VHNLADSDEGAFGLVRNYLGYFPSSAWEPAPVDVRSRDRGERPLDEILDIIPEALHRPYDIRRVIELIADDRRMLEIQPLFGASIVTAYVRIGGRAVAVVANQPCVRAGAIDRPAADKAAHFLDVANAYDLPVVFLTDNPGIMSGRAAERDGTLRAAARMYAAQSRLRSPKLHVTLRKAFGFGSSIMAMNPFDSQTLSLALPTVSLGALPAASGSEAAKLADDQKAGLERQQGGAWEPADSMAFDEVIDPRELRDALLAGLAFSRARLSQSTQPALSSGIRP